MLFDIVYLKTNKKESYVKSYLLDLKKRDEDLWVVTNAVIRLLSDNCNHKLHFFKSLKDGLYEIKTKRKHLQSRIYYCFYDNKIWLLWGGIKQNPKTQQRDIEKARELKKLLR
jgi:phage-related protein